MDPVGEARAELDAIRGRELADPHVDPRDATAWHIPDTVAPRAVVLLHGITNSPLQYERFVPWLTARGDAVIVPRFRYHGYRNRMTDAVAKLTADDLQTDTLRSVSIAARCGKRVIVAGISVGAALAGWVAGRVAIDKAVAIAPFCGVRFLPGSVNDGFGALLRALPNRMLWWDPRAKANQQPWHAYPRFPTHALGVSLGIGSEIAGPGDAYARRVDLVLNAHEPIINNAHASRRFGALRERGVEVVTTVWDDLPKIHDIIEPEISAARIDLVYPRLAALIDA